MKMSQSQRRPDSSMTVDSLEVPLSSQEIDTQKLQVSPPQKNSTEKYPKTILMPSESNNKTKKSNSNSKDVKNYLILNKKPRKQTSYLEKFREKFSNIIDSKGTSDAKSTEAEVGDTHRESIGDDSNVEQFFETECYNEIFYQVLINGSELRSSSGEEDAKTELTLTPASGVGGGGGGRAAYSDATGADSSTTRRSARAESFPHRSRASNSSSNCGLRSAVPPSVSSQAEPAKEESTRTLDRSRSSSRRGRVCVEAACRLGGLGPDLQALRPRSERARSVQRYSDKVRLENKIKITRHSTSLSEARAAAGDVDKLNTRANKKPVPAKEKSVDTVHNNVKKSKETKNPKEVKNEHHSEERENSNKTKRKGQNKQIHKISSKGDYVKEENNQKNWQFSYGFEPERSALGVLRALEQRHEALRAALSDVCRAPARPRAALTGRH